MSTKPGQSQTDLEPEDEDDPADAEPSLGAPERHPRLAPTAYAQLHTDHSTEARQTNWSAGGDTGECEVENEHGGDILDEPHDDDEREPSAGWGHETPVVADPGSSYSDRGLAVEHEGPDPCLCWSPGGRCAPHLREVMRQLRAIERRQQRPRGNLVPVDFPSWLVAHGMVAGDAL